VDGLSLIGSIGEIGCQKIEVLEFPPQEGEVLFERENGWGRRF
jgi:hypothetical protein